MIPYGRHSIDESDIDSVVEVLRHGNLTQGVKVQEFEEKLAEYTGAKFAVAVSSGTAALHLACLAIEVGDGDNVITSANTFVASANCAQFVGAETYFVDIESESLNLSPDNLELRCQQLKSIKAIVPVHFAGAPCDMVRIREISNQHGAKIIEDCSHALGSKYLDDSKVGCCKYSDMSTFSFHPVKAIAAGEGGAITTNSEELYSKLIRLRSHGINKGNDEFENPSFAYDNGKLNPWYYEMQELGYNFRITDIQCALALSQLKRLDSFIDKRRTIAFDYDKFFCNLSDINSTQLRYRELSAIHIYVLQINFKNIGYSRREFMMLLRERNIGTQVHYMPVPAQPYYINKGFNVSDYPNCYEYYEKALSIPVYFDLEKKQQQYIIENLQNLVN